MDFEATGAYDLIVSGLPFNAFENDLVFNILRKYLELSLPGTIISFFEYAALPTLRQTFFPTKEYELTRAALDDFIKLYEFDSQKILLNLPPATVHHLIICDAH